MDPESPLSRVERTFWTVWYYITGAVNRFIRTESADIVSNDPNPNQESAADIKPPDFDSADGDTSRGVVDEEQPVATSSLLSSSRPVVAWELCTTEIDLGPDEESMQHKTQLRKGSESKEDGEGTREEQHGQTGNEISEVFFTNESRAREDEQEKMESGKLHTCEGAATSENDECEHEDAGPQNLRDVAMSEERTQAETAAEKETFSSVTLDDHQRKDETTEEPQIKEEDDKMHHQDEQDVEAENIEAQMCITTGLSPNEEDHMHRREAAVQKNDAVTLDDHLRKDDLIKEAKLMEEDDKIHSEDEQDLEAEITEVTEEDEQDLQAEDAEAKMCIITALTPELDKERQVTEEDDKMYYEDEQDLEEEVTEGKASIITGLSPELDDHMHEREMEVQKNDAVTSDDHHQKDGLIKETQLMEEDDKLHNEDEQDLEAEITEVTEEDEQDLQAKDNEVKVSIITGLNPEEEDHMHEGEAEVQSNDAVTPDDHLRKDEIIKEAKLMEEDDQMHSEDKQDLQPETTEVTEEDDKMYYEDKQDLEEEVTEGKVSIITGLSPDLDNHMHEREMEVQKNDAVTSDDHHQKDGLIKETQLMEEDDKLHNEDEQDLEAEITEVTEEDEQDLQAKDNEVTEEDDKMHREYEQDLEAETTEIKVCIITGLSREEEDHMHEGEAEVEKNDAVTPDDHLRQDEIIKETKLKQEDDRLHCKDEKHLEAETTEVTEDDDKMHREDERDLVAENNEVKVCIITGLSPEEEFHIHEGEAEVEKNDALTPDDHLRKDELIKETQLKEENDKMCNEDEQDLVAEDNEVKVCITTGLSPDEEDHMHEGEVQKNDAVTPDDHLTKDELIKETQLKEEDDKLCREEEHDLEGETTEVTEEDDKMHCEDEKDLEAETTEVTEEGDKMHHEDEQDLEAEDNEVKVCITTGLSREEEDHMHEGEAAVQKNDAVIPDDHPRKDETMKETHLMEEEDKMHHEDEPDLEAETCDDVLASENVNKSNEKTDQVENQLSAFGELSDVSVDKLILVGQHHMMAHRSENDEDDKEKWGETEQHAITEKENIDEAAANKTIEVPELEENISTVTEGSQEENILTEYDSCSKEAAQTSTTQLHTAEFTDKEKEDGRVTELQTKTRQAGVTIPDISVDERLVDKDQDAEESFFSKTCTGECYKEIICSNTSVTVKPKAETAQEMSEELKKFPLGINEGQFAILQELNTPTCEETQEGFSKYNNDLRGADENTTQRFLEAGDCEEIPATQLPEEVESREWESLQNSGCSAGSDYLLLKEPKEEKQESREEAETGFDLVVEEHAGILDLTREAEKPFAEGVIQESGHLFEEEEGNLLASSMKTEVTVGLADDTDKRTEGLQDGATGSSFSKEANAMGAESEKKEAATEEELVVFDTIVTEESEQAINLEQHSSRPSSLQEDTTEPWFAKHSAETEPKSLDDSAVEMQDKGIKRDERGHGDEEEEAEDGVQSKNDMENLHLQVTETAGELITEKREKESPLNAESELSQHSETQEMKNQSPDRALEISEITEVTETADESETAESKPEDLPVTSSEKRGNSTSGYQDVIDEEILDLWIETAMTEDTDDIKKQPQPGQLLDTRTDTLIEEQGEISSEKEEESLTDPISGESVVVSDTEMSSSTVESGFLDQSLSESGTQNSETQLPKSPSTDSLQGIHDIVASVSADISGFTAQPQPQTESQDVLTEESAETEKESIADAGVASPEGTHLNQESDKSLEKAGEERVETVETESGSQNAEAADPTTLTKMSAPSQVEKTEAEEARLEITVSDSTDELKPTESKQSESGSQAASTESASQGDTQTESEKSILNLSSLDEPQPGQSEDIADSSLLEQNKAEAAKEPPTKSEDENKVDAPVLDFAVQRSRIAVKNRRVRPPKNARSLLQMPSAEPTASPRVPLKVPAGVPLGGMGIGIKLPGLGAGFPVLKKTQRVVTEENTQETLSQQELQTKPEEKSDAAQQDEAPKKPKWMPPKHAGFGNPLMAELKTKLKKTPKE